MPDSIPIEIPGFELITKLGEGGMGTVYKARQISLDRLVAIKTLPPEFASNPDYIQHFQHEAKTEATLKHTNIVQVHEAGSVGDVYYFIMEYVSGYTVQSWLERKGPIPEDDCLAIADAVARALEYAWDKARIMHGDIKPGNIMIDEDGTIKIGDFLALTLPGRGGVKAVFSDHILGTPNYMSPEQLIGQADLDYRADIYSLGAVMYHLLSGTLPFADATGDDIYKAPLVSHLEDIQELAPNVQTPTAWLIEKMLVREAAARPGSWTDVLHDIVRVRKGLPPHEPLPQEGISTMKRSPRRAMPAPPKKKIRVKPRAGKAHHDTPPHASDEEEPTEEQPSTRVVPGVVLGIALLILAFVFTLPGRYLFDETDLHDVPESLFEEVESTSPKSETKVNAALEPMVEPVTRPPVAAPETSPPEFVPAEEPASTAKEQAELRSRQFRQYTALSGKVMALMKRRLYESADQLLNAWLADSRDHGYDQKATRLKARNAEALGVFQFLEANESALRGIKIGAGTRRGVLKKIEDGQVQIMKPLEEGQALLSENVRTLSERDITKLLKAAAPDRYVYYQTVLALADAKSSEGAALLEQVRLAGLEAGPLAEWKNDAEKTMLNLMAYRSLKETRTLLEQGDSAGAQARHASAAVEYAESDVFTWAEADEWANLDAALTQPADPLPEPTPLEEVHADESSSELPDEEEPLDLSSVSLDDMARVTVADLLEQYVSLDGKLVRLRFQYRGNIEQVTATTYATHLAEDGASVAVVFPEEGFRWLRSLPTAQQNSPKKVYGIVDAVDRRLRLVGRNQKMLPGQNAAEYSW